MADIIERVGVLKTKDDKENTYALYPITKIEAVEGLENALQTIDQQLNGYKLSVVDKLPGTGVEKTIYFTYDA